MELDFRAEAMATVCLSSASVIVSRLMVRSHSLSAFGHAGYGGAFIWADPEREVVGIYLSVSPRMHRDIGVMNSDLFQNAVHAAIID